MTNRKLKPIKTVTIIGANSTMGSLLAGVISSFGNAKVYMLARNIDKAKEGVEKAVRSLKTEVIRKNLIPCSYDSDLEKFISKADWILEALAEDYSIKEEFGKKISDIINPDTIISTTTSGLSIERLSKTFKGKSRERYFGTHFFNPPYKMRLCELIRHSSSDPDVTEFFADYLEKILLRKVVCVADSPAFAGNRIGFQLMNEVAQYTQKHNPSAGIALMDVIVGRYTGKALPPFETLDLVGLDTYQAIVDNIYQNTNESARDTFKLPKFVSNLISSNRLGNKTGEGFYKTINGTKQRLVYNINNQNYEPIPSIDVLFINRINEEIYYGRYAEAMDILKKTKGPQADIARYFILRYISYSLSLIGTIVGSTKTIDTVMAYGFNWMPPSALVDFMGGVKEVREMIKKYHLPVPEILTSAKNNNRLYDPEQILDVRSLLRS